MSDATLLWQLVKRMQLENGAMSLVREPTESELRFFKENPHVAGYAAPDDRVVLNPNANGRDMKSVAINEATRIYLRRQKNKPSFKLTGEQAKQFQGYGAEDDIRATIAARILSGDPSARNVTDEQRSYVDQVLTPGVLGFLK